MVKHRLINFYHYILLLAALVSLGGAFAAEYIGGIQPCLLCLYHRYAWGGLCIVVLMIHIFKSKKMALVAGVYCLGMCALSTYQVLVEEKYIKPHEACKIASSKSKPQTAEELWRSMDDKPLAPCDQKPVKWGGLSMAAYSGFLSVILSILCFLSWFYCPRKRMYGIS